MKGKEVNDNGGREESRQESKDRRHAKGRESGGGRGRRGTKKLRNEKYKVT